MRIQSQDPERRWSFSKRSVFSTDGATVRIPPLRERRDEIVPLAERFARDAAKRDSVGFSRFAESAQSALVAHDWPGNIRELKNVIERAVLFSRGAPIDVEHLLLTLSDSNPSLAGAPLDHSSIEDGL